MDKNPDMALWTGRDDNDGQQRWHQQISPLLKTDQRPGIAILGIASDEGVKRNQGRIGAAAGPDAIREKLANQAYHLNRPIYDAGNLDCKRKNLESMQEEQAILVQSLLQQNHFPLLLGGGHEIALGSFLGLERHIAPTTKAAPIGIINFDAHFDLRTADQSTSGTPFRQIAEHCQTKGLPFHYFCLGISEVANTETLFKQAEQLKVQYLKDEEINSWQLPQVEKRLAEFLAPCQAVYLSIDLDVLPAETAPGVSAPAARGLPLPLLEHLLRFIKLTAGKRLRVADIAEYNPRYDIDGRTAKVAARLGHLISRKENL